ncbi:MAG: aminomethyl-transferring glycine dehydrogenase subunit GcvPA [Promethearchaeota archaeon]
MDYTPHSLDDIGVMLEFLGIHDIMELFATIPEEIRITKNKSNTLLVPGVLDKKGLDELSLVREIEHLASKNKSYKNVFLGAGCYYHHIPAVVDYLVSRGEFWTSYTPYQAEISQGFLQAIFEYQTMIARLTGMKYSNASLHDCATAMVDAAVMASSENKKRKTVILAGMINPLHVNVFKTSTRPRGWNILEIQDIKNIESSITRDVFAIVIQSPDFFGNIINIKNIVKQIKDVDDKIIVIQTFTEALSLAILEPPGACGVDIVVGDGQSFGIPMSFGGPGLGIIAVRSKKLLHKMPGRISGLTREKAGNRYGFTLTLQAREQHIRRDKALSNICSNEALNMLRALIYLASLGKTGLRNLASLNVKLANRVKMRIDELDGFACINEQPIFNEFVIRADRERISRIIKSCNEKNILGPLHLGIFNDEWSDLMLLCVTEMCDEQGINDLIKIMEANKR